jgi:hypothetical protein
MSGVLALALAQMGPSHGTVPNAVPVGQALANGTSGTLGTVGTGGTPGTLSGTYLDGEAVVLGAIEERAALAADRVPACYLDAWAHLQCQRPLLLVEGDWRRAIDDGGRFLDAWGADAATLQWSTGELFDAPREGRLGGLLWQLRGERVNALGEDRARLADGRTIERKQL